MTQRAHRIFISHSAHRTEEPATQEFVDALVARMAALPELDPLVDQRGLAAGDEWMQTLYSWMGLCDAAVIVLSPRAVTRENSSWVPREANLLMWRKALDARFLVIPVLIGGLEEGALAGNPYLGDSRLGDLQLVRSGSDDEKLDAIMAALGARFAGANMRRVFDPLQTHVEDSIARFAPPPSVDAALATFYGKHAWMPYTQPPRNLSLHMVRDASQAAVDDVITLVAAGSQAQFGLGALLFGALYPMRLPAEFACGLLALCREQEGGAPVLVNAHSIWPVEMLLRASTGLPESELRKKWYIVELVDGWGEDDEGEAIRFLARELAETALGTGEWELLSDHPDPVARLAEQFTFLDEQLAALRKETGVPVLVCARFSERWTELIPALSARFPTCVFLLWSGPSLPPQGSYGPDRAAPLDPTWLPGKDQEWRREYKRKSKQHGGGPA